MSSLQDKGKSFIGNRLVVGKTDYGIVSEIVTIIDGGERVILVCDSGRNVDLASVLRYFTFSRNDIVYPDGTDYVLRQSKPKKLYRANSVLPANMPSNVRIGSVTVSITKNED